MPKPSTPSAPPPQAPIPPVPSPSSDAEIQYIPYHPSLETAYLDQIRTLISSDLSEPYSIYVYRYFLYSWPQLCFLAVERPAHAQLQPEAEAEAEAGPRRSGSAAQTGEKARAQAVAPLLAVVVCKLSPHPTYLNSLHQRPHHPPPHTHSSPTPAPPNSLPPNISNHPSPPSSTPSPPGPLRGYIAMLATATTHRRRGLATNLVRHAIVAMGAGGADEVVLETEVDNLGALRLYENLGFGRMKRLGRYYLNGNSAFRLGLVLRCSYGEEEEEGEGQEGEEEDEGWGGGGGSRRIEGRG